MNSVVSRNDDTNFFPQVYLRKICCSAFLCDSSVALYLKRISVVYAYSTINMVS